MKKNILFSILAIFVFSNAFSQVNKNGLPLTTKYTDKDYGSAGQIWAIEQDNRGVMYFGCNYGLKTYDGTNWKSYNNPHSTIVRSLAVGKNGVVYYGAESDFGMMQPDEKGELKFHSFYLDKHKNGDSINFSSVWKTNIADGRVYFQAFESLYYCDLPIKFDDNDTLINKVNIIEPETKFHLSFAVNNEFFIREWDKGLCRIKNGKLQLIQGGEKFALLKIYTMLPYDDNKILIGTREAGFFIYDKTNNKNPITPFNVGNNNEEIIGSVIYCGEKLSNGNYVIGTILDGIFIFNQKGIIINHYNYKTGLPKVPVISLFYNNNDPNAQLWFAQPDIGVLRADVSSPFTVWNSYLGVDGSVTDIIKFKTNSYLIADNSLFRLKEKEGRLVFQKIYSEQYNIWKLLEFKIQNSNDSKLIMASFSGIYEIEDSVVHKIEGINNAKTIYQSCKDSSILYVGNKEGLSLVKFFKGKWQLISKTNDINLPISDILETDAITALASPGRGILLLNDLSDTSIVVLDASRGLPLLGRDIFLEKYKEKILIMNGSGIFQNLGVDSVAPFYDFGKQYCNGSIGVYQILETDDDIWMSIYNSRSSLEPNHRIVKLIKGKVFAIDSVFAKSLPLKTTYNFYSDNGYVWILNEKGLYKYNRLITNSYDIQYNTLITKVAVSNDSILFLGNYFEKTDTGISVTTIQDKGGIPILSYKNNMLVFSWTAPYFHKENETKYSFRLVGNENENWTRWNTKTDTRFTNLKEGDYTFEVKAKNIYNIESSVASYSFTITAPWYRTIWAYILFTILGILFIWLIVKLYTKKLKAENEKLEQIVKERTAEIRQQNEEITAQRDEIHAQKLEVEKAKDKIEKQKESITDSIHYASRIQEAVLPPENYLKEILGEHFVLFRPRDIVSGDFYWATKRGNKTIIVAADSTGHGVPGAFMSMLGMSFLNEIINKDEVLQANIILNRLRDNVKRSLRQTGKENEAKDGMDIALCVIDTDEMKLQFAGAYNPLYLLRNNEIIRVKADRMPIGIYLREKESFTNNIVDLQKGDLLYIFSDGYVDQFGGKNDSKIKSAKFKELLLENCNKPMEQQKAALVNFLEDWMDNYDKKGRKYSQIDDILVIGIEI